MKDEFPAFPFLAMLSVTAGCTAIGWAIGGDLGDVYGLGGGLVLGFAVFFFFLWLGDPDRLPTQMPWRLDSATPPLRGPRRWLARLRMRKTKTETKVP